MNEELPLVENDTATKGSTQLVTVIVRRANGSVRQILKQAEYPDKPGEPVLISNTFFLDGTQYSEQDNHFIGTPMVAERWADAWSKAEMKELSSIVPFWKRKLIEFGYRKFMDPAFKPQST